MEQTYAILDINICDKESEKTDNGDIIKKMPLATVIKIRKFANYLKTFVFLFNIVVDVILILLSSKKCRIIYLIMFNIHYQINLNIYCIL